MNTPSEFMTQPRYAGVPTFMRTPLVLDNWSDIDIGVVGVPFDAGVTNRPGARHGPREVRNQSSLVRRLNPPTGAKPFDICSIADLGDVPMDHPFDLEQSHEDIRAFFERIHASGTVPLAVGGDHSLTLPVMRAIAKHRPVGMIHIDAHADTGDGSLNCRFHHGSPFRRAVEEGLLDPHRTIQIGIRGPMNDFDLWRFSYDSGMRVVTIEEFRERGVQWAIDEAKRIVGDGPTYLSFDIDSLDPAFAPGTGTPEIGGITSFEAQQLVRGARGVDLVGADVVEVSPPWDQSGMTALVGANIMFEVLCVLAEATAARNASK